MSLFLCAASLLLSVVSALRASLSGGSAIVEIAMVGWGYNRVCCYEGGCGCIPLIVVDPLLDPLWCRRSSSFSDLMKAALVRWVRRAICDVLESLPALAKNV